LSTSPFRGLDLARESSEGIIIFIKGKKFIKKFIYFSVRNIFKIV
jgi:hypothetical protein